MTRTEANAILDSVRAGSDHSPATIDRALKKTGDLSKLTEVLELIREGPKSSRTIAATLGRKFSTVGAQLRTLGDKGLIAAAWAGNKSLWCLPELAEDVAAHIRAEAKAAAMEKARIRSQARFERQRERRAEAEESAAEAWLSPCRRIVPASECAMPKGLGPASVFQLGAT
jgi:hypothetical protein